VELRDTELRLKTAATVEGEKYNALKSLDNAAEGCVPACPHVSKNVWTVHNKAWTKTWTLRTRMPKLTQAALKRLIKKTGRHSDGGGLYFRVIGEGKSYWIYRYRVGGKEREASLGPFSDLTLAEAREKHAAMRKSVVVDKTDPLAEKRRMKTVRGAAASPTFGQMADEFIRTHEATWRNDKHRWQWMQTLTTHAAAIRDLPIDEVDTEAVLRVLTPLWSRTPETAARLRGRIEAVLASAQVDGWIPEDKPARPSRGHALCRGPGVREAPAGDAG
jgi:Arm DNA-binding domain